MSRQTRKWRSLARLSLIALLAALALATSYLPSAAAPSAPLEELAPAQVDVGYPGIIYGSGANSTPTGEKPESKLWWNDGRWWGAMFSQDAGGYRAFWLNLSNQTWVDSGTALGNRNGDKVDVLWDQGSQKLYMVSHVFSTSASPTTSNWAQLFRYSYNSSTKTYSLDAGFPVDVSRGRAEAVVLEKDSTGRLWVTYVESNKVMINHSLSNDLTWGDPFQLPGSGTVNSDDISSVIAFGGNKIGVVWSNQNTDAYYLAIHNDGAPPNAWTIETGIQGNNLVDDHINLATDTQGRIYLAGKTSLTGDNPLVVLDVRGPSGGWSRYVYGMDADGHTRPIVLTDTQNQKLYMFATSPESSGAIYMKSADIGNIQFVPGKGQPFISSSTTTSINNATSTKQSLNNTTGLVVLASNSSQRRYYHNYMPLGGGGGTPTPTPTTTTPTPTPTTVTPTPTTTTTTPTPTTVTPTPTTVTPTPTTTTPTPTQPPGAQLVFSPAHDTHVKTDRPTSNYGSEPYVRVRLTDSVDYDSYFKFNVSGTGGSVQSAILRLYSYDGGPDGGTLYTTSNNYLNSSTPWTESGLTWNNAPGLGTPLYSVGVVPDNSWAAWDVTSVITGDGTYSFALSNFNSNSVFYYSKEAASFKPYLALEIGGTTGTTAFMETDIAGMRAALTEPLNTPEPTLEITDEPTETPQPTLEVTDEPAPAPAPTIFSLPYADDFTSSAGWSASGVWQHDALAGRGSGGWFANSAVRGLESTLQLNGLIDLTSVLTPRLTFWQKAALTAGDRVAVDISLDGGLSWLALEDSAGTVSDWTQHTVDLSAYAGQLIALRFRLDTTGELPVGTASIGLWLDDVAVNVEIPTPPTEPPAEPTDEPTDAPASEPQPTEPAETDEPEATATPTVEPTQPVETPIEDVTPPASTLLTVESDDPAVLASGDWTAHDTLAASGGRYVYSSGSLSDSLTLGFTGTQVEVVFALHPALGSFAIEVDGALLQVVSSTASDTIFGARASVTGLPAGAHVLRIVPTEGTIAIDAFAVEGLAPLPEQPAVEPTLEPTLEPQEPTPPATPTETPWEVTPTSTPLPLLLPVYDSFETEQTWLADGSWTYALNGGYSGSGWYASGATPGASTLTYAYQIDLRAAQNPQLTFWQTANLAGDDTISLEVSLDGGLTWLAVDVQRGWSGGWAPRTVDLSGFRGAVIGLRFSLLMGPSGQKGNRPSGLGIDELIVQEVILPTATPLPTLPPTEPPAEVLPTPEPTQAPTDPPAEVPDGASGEEAGETVTGW